MKITHKDLRHGVVKIRIDSPEDTWYLSNIIEENDSVSGMTERKIKIGGSDEKSKISRRMVFLKIRVEKIEDGTRISGPIIEAPEDIPKGDYHSFAVEDGVVLTIEKDKWSKYVLKKLEDACESGHGSILIVAFDREDAIFALLKKNGYDIILEINGDVSKKDYTEKKSGFYEDIIKNMIEYDKRYSFTSIILASPAFWKEYLLKELKDDSIKKKLVMATCSGIDGTTINEILKRPELKTVLEKDRSTREMAYIEDVLAAVQKGNAAYGFKEVSEKLNSGNMSKLLISENLIKTSRLKGDFNKLDELMNAAESIDAEIIIVGSDDAAKKLDGLSGIACLLRWKENYEV